MRTLRLSSASATLFRRSLDRVVEVITVALGPDSAVPTTRYDFHSYMVCIAKTNRQRSRACDSDSAKVGPGTM